MTVSKRILVAEDDPQMQLAIKASLSRAGYEVLITGDGKAALTAFEAQPFDLVISDQRMPEMTGQELLAALQARGSTTPVIMITAHGTIDQAVDAMRLGAADFLAKPFSSEDLLRIVERVLTLVSSGELEIQAKPNRAGRPIITNDPLMIRILEVAEAVSRSDATVLVQGESGTGKELIARLVHSASPRAKQQFVAVNCAALPENLLESELFGHEKGSFTGAQNRKIGKFELAHGGTILLDEISEMELGLQAKLLRVIQEREVDRVGGKDPVAIDVRVVATTNRDLQAMVDQGKFRADLYYRLNVIPLTLPPLRERKCDIKLLIEHFMRQYLGGKAQAIRPEILAQLEAYHWPGNIRELQNAVERAAILSTGRAPVTEDFFIAKAPSSAPSLAQQIEREASAPASAAVVAQSGLMIKPGMTVAEMERALIFETLKSTSDNRTEAAKLLGISIRTLRNKLNEYRANEAIEKQ